MPDHPAPILVGVEKMPGNAAALEFAARQAAVRGARVDLVHVVHPIYLLPADVGQFDTVDQEARSAGHAALARARAWLEKHHPGLTVTTELAQGAVVAELVARSDLADLVVVQPRDLPTVARVMTSAVTNSLAARACAPVAVVRTVADPDRPREGVVVGVDRVAALPVVHEALEWARRLGTYLRVVHTWTFLEGHGEYAFSGLDSHAYSSLLADTMAGPLGETFGEFPDVDVRVSVGYGRAADALVTESVDAALIVIGRHDPRLPFGSHVGPVVRAVLGHAACPVVVVDPHPSTAASGAGAHTATHAATGSATVAETVEAVR